MGQTTRDSYLTIPAIILIAGFILLPLSGCASNLPAGVNSVSDTPAATQFIPSPSPAPTETANPFGDWSEYKNESIGFRFLYPSSWYGPDVYEQDGSLRLEVGSDVVYPYGTDRTDQKNTIPDSYFITINYFENTQNRTWDDFINSGWITSYLDLLNLENGQSVSTTRSLVIRVREVTLGDFVGLEYIATLSDTAQTERGYAREIMAFDKELNWLRVTGFPNLVEITDPENWKDDYRRVDEANLEIFEKIAESIIIQ